MSEDEQAIRGLIDAWMQASQSGDVDAVLALMTDDVVFSVCGQEPFGKAVFAAGARAMSGVKIEGGYDIVELQVRGDWAFLRNRLDMRMTAPNGPTVRRAGYTLTLLRKEADGQWRVARDANMMAAKS